MTLAPKSIVAAVLGLLLMTPRSGAQSHAEFRLVGYDANKLSTALRFENDKRDWRSVVLMDGKQGGLLIQTPKSKGILDWSDITDVRFTPSKSRDLLNLGVVEYVDYYDHTQEIFEMGLIDQDHLKALRQRYHQFVKFRISQK